MPDAAKHWDGPGISAWEPWRPEDVAKLLSSAASSWCVVGGWAIDVWLGRRTRDHSDIEVAVPRADFDALRRLFEPVYRLHAIGDGEVFALDAAASYPEGKHQCWVLGLQSCKWRLDLMLEPGDHETWIFRRDARIQAPRAQMVRRRDGIAFLKPEGVLLYKAKACREKDEADFSECLEHLNSDARAWLAKSLTIVHPGHRWIHRLHAE